MKCPACNVDGAYVGLSVVECQDGACRYYVGGAPFERKTKPVYTQMQEAIDAAIKACSSEYEKIYFSDFKIDLDTISFNLHMPPIKYYMGTFIIDQ